jgi:hypothetical protein
LPDVEIGSTPPETEDTELEELELERTEDSTEDDEDKDEDTDDEDGWLLELTVFEQIVPVTTGTGAGALGTPLLPCTPNSTVWPGAILAFQPISFAL